MRRTVSSTDRKWGSCFATFGAHVRERITRRQPLALEVAEVAAQRRELSHDGRLRVLALVQSGRDTRGPRTRRGPTDRPPSLSLAEVLRELLEVGRVRADRLRAEIAFETEMVQELAREPFLSSLPVQEHGRRPLTVPERSRSEGSGAWREAEVERSGIGSTPVARPARGLLQGARRGRRQSARDRSRERIEVESLVRLVVGLRAVSSRLSRSSGNDERS